MKGPLLDAGMYRVPADATGHCAAIMSTDFAAIIWVIMLLLADLLPCCPCSVPKADGAPVVPLADVKGWQVISSITTPLIRAEHANEVHFGEHAAGYWATAVISINIVTEFHLQDQSLATNYLLPGFGGCNESISCFLDGTHRCTPPTFISPEHWGGVGRECGAYAAAPAHLPELQHVTAVLLFLAAR